MTYIVSQGDTLETISRQLLGADRVDEIVVLNNLRYPYISDDPYEQYGQPRGTLQLFGPVNAGSNPLLLGNLNSLTVLPLDTVFFQDRTTGSYEAAAIDSIVAADGDLTIAFQAPLQNSYTLAAIVTVFVNQQNVITKVLRTGDILYLPVTVAGVYSLSSQIDATDVFGTDIMLDTGGFIVRENQDWATVSEISNVQQAVVNRWKTPVGGLPGEFDYGNRMHELVGESNQPYYHSLALAFAKQSALTDPRVESVNSLSLIAAKDKAFLAGSITAVNSPQSYVVKTSIPMGGGS